MYFSADSTSRNIRALLAGSKKVTVESIRISYQSNRFILMLADIGSILDAANLCNIDNNDIPDTGNECLEWSKLGFMKTLLSFVDGNASSVSVKDAPLSSMTILTNNVVMAQSGKVKGHACLGKGVRAICTGIGLWTVSLGKHFKLNIVHTQLRDAWNKLQAEPKMSLESVTDEICAQADEKEFDGKKLTELYLLRAILGLRIWLEIKRTPSKSRGLKWYEMTAVSFIEPYATIANNSAGPAITKLLKIRGECDEQMLSWVSAVLLQVVSPVPVMLEGASL